MVLLGRVLQEQFGKPLLPRRVAGGEDRPLQRSHSALELRRLLVVDLDAECRADLTHPLQRRLLLGDDGIDLTDAEIGEKVRLVDRPFGVPDIGKFGARVGDGRGGGAFLHQLAQPVDRLLASGRQVAFQLLARFGQRHPIALPLGRRAPG